jgi:hypothetical protein
MGNRLQSYDNNKLDNSVNVYTTGNRMKFKIIKAALAGLLLTLSGFANSAIILSGDVASGSGVLTFTTDYSFNITSNGTVRGIAFDEWGVTNDENRAVTFVSESINTLLNGVLSSLPDIIMADNAGDIFGDLTPADAYLFATTSGILVSVGDILTIQASSFNLAAISNWNSNVDGQFDGDLFLIDNVGIRLSENGAAVPEPSTLAVLALGLIGLGARRFKK